MTDNKPLIPPHIFWPGMVVGLLSISLTMAAITVVAALRDPSAVVEKDYYDRALHWDQSKAEQQQMALLGWTVDTSFAAPDAAGDRAILVRLTDAQGAPIQGAVVHASYFHNALATQVTEATLAPDAEPGLYRTEPAPLRFGFWTISVEVQADGNRWTGTQSVELHTE